MRFSFRVRWNSTIAYVALLGASFVIALLLSYLFGTPINDIAYDLIFKSYHADPWQPESVVLAIDELTLADCGGIRGVRKPLADGLRVLQTARPKAVVVDVTLADRGEREADATLAQAVQSTPNLVISTETVDEGREWQDPRPEFAKNAVLASALADPDYRGVTRQILLDNVAGRDRRWALSLEAFRLSRNATIRESMNFTRLRGGLARDELHVGDTTIPVQIRNGRRLMRVRYFPLDMNPPRVSLKRLIDNPKLAEQMNGKVVFIGLTVQNADVRDRLFTPMGRLSGIDIHVAAFETIAQKNFLVDSANYWEMLICFGLVCMIGAAFRYLPGWWAYSAGAALLFLANVIPYWMFVHRVVFPFATSASVAWLGTLTAASYYHLVVRRNLRIEQTSRERYQQAMHFVTHEMRTPLSAIQGSSELISRYALPEEKRKQIADLINSESKRLARMVEIFLNVERLTAGQMELKREPIGVKEMIEVCVSRVRPLAERKHIGVTLEPISHALHLTGDRELMEYACYNLLTNAVKYSPQRTEVTVSCWKDDTQIRIAVRDQGIGMDQKEVKQIFQKFYRTKKAEESGEAGTGIGLSIVQQIVEQHGGRIEVTSKPGAGSCFTLVMPARAVAAVPTAVERN
ncbi:MAG TPA: ATP-binding protein [Candidatus Solibacter sp.]|nr:ATP-binding protein [Candidatus Solibacter sp.]